MNEWKLTEAEKRGIRGWAIILDPSPSADRELKMIEFGEMAAQRKLVEWLEREVIYTKNDNFLALGPEARGKWREMRKRVGLK